ncbi:unnamed protein product [Polarella glacialis]|uniref:Endonuclease/exonuclease/phosphatase domain-containing protein n=1 Tax=Polarella glacialis TaxID=89957 RepID=A0A813FQ57_POLGL|nr:unnamed protein product [Polarella glacialis]
MATSVGRAMEMKVSLKKGVGFFVRAASVFLRGAEAREASEGIEAKPKRPPVEELLVSGLGDAIVVAVAVAERMEADGLAEIAGVETLFPEMPDGETRSSQIRITLRRLNRPSLEGGLAVVTWNLAAINNNPFEYWITHTDGAYAELMAQVEQFIENPGERDAPIGDIFGQARYDELRSLMEAEGWRGLDEVDGMWLSDLSIRKAVSGILKDKGLGDKRLCSMPDRFTNTTNLSSGEPAFRPSVINHCANRLSSVAEWWPQWKAFMFQDYLEVPTGSSGSKRVRPCELLPSIKRAKYPAITDAEEAVSVPLQCLCLAIFDAILVHMMHVLSPDGHWQKIKESICDATFRKKNAKTTAILDGYREASVLCLQEASVNFLGDLGVSSLATTHHIVAPAKADAQRDQNSAVLLSRQFFPAGAAKELTEDVIAALDVQPSPLEAGDLIVVRTTSATGTPFLVASFHGDTNGKSTSPVLRAVAKVLAAEGAGCQLIFGMDANTHLAGSSSLYGVKEFLQDCEALGLRTCWPDGKDMAECLTTCNARTFLQPQLNKACPSTLKLQKGDVNPKDHIVFRRSGFEPVSTFKDNTARRQYVESMCFPTLQFPSDHGLVATALESKL